MEIEKILKLCKKRNELDFLFNLTKIIADTDSIGEKWTILKNEYTKEDFNNAEKNEDGEYDSYLEIAGVKIYELYLKQIKIVK